MYGPLAPNSRKETLPAVTAEMPLLAVVHFIAMRDSWLAGRARDPAHAKKLARLVPEGVCTTTSFASRR